MVAEEDVPLDQRRLRVEGTLTPATLKLVSDGLPSVRPSTSRIVFASYAYADLPLGKSFDCIFHESDPRSVERAQSVLVAVTQHWAKPFDGVPHGWKTVWVIDFPGGVPRLIGDLSAVNAWGESESVVCLSSRETHAAFLASRAQG